MKWIGISKRYRLNKNHMDQYIYYEDTPPLPKSRIMVSHTDQGLNITIRCQDPRKNLSRKIWASQGNWHIHKWPINLEILLSSFHPSWSKLGTITPQRKSLCVVRAKWPSCCDWERWIDFLCQILSPTVQTLFHVSETTAGSTVFAQLPCRR